MNGEQFKGLKGVKEIMGDEKEVDLLYKSLERYKVHLPLDYHKSSNWEDIAEELCQIKQVLCIVSDRKSCRELHGLMPEGTFHLSALMCGQHRSEIIKNIKRRLKNGEDVRVISTQLVEAGVDLDFPIVYRALAGLDSIAQAAGRCNREGKANEYGKVVVFVPPRKPPIGLLRKAADSTINILSQDDDFANINIFNKYFEELYWKAKSLDKERIIDLLNPDKQELGIYFRTAAKKFQIIDENAMKAILVPYGEGAELISRLQYAGPVRELMRKLQRFTVNIYNHEFDQMIRRGSLYEVSPGIFALSSDFDYSEQIGLLVDPIFDPGSFII